MKSRATRPELSAMKTLRTLETLRTLKTSKVLTFGKTKSMICFFAHLIVL